MTGAFHIRRAGPADAKILAQLRYDFRVELDPPTEPGENFLTRCAGWMSRELAPDGSWRCWLAVLGETPVGTLWMQLIEKLPNPNGHRDYHGYISSVYVVPEFRNAGLGSALLQACISEAETLNVDALFLWPSARSRPLYARHGFVVRDDLLERR
jgi:GNAT superfamily N-acetyltransferase